MQDEQTHSESCRREWLVKFLVCLVIVLTGLGKGPDTLHDTPELVSFPEAIFHMLVQCVFIFVFAFLLCTLLRVALLGSFLLSEAW